MLKSITRIGVLGVVVMMGGNASADTSAPTPRDTPLGRLIMGNIGRIIVLGSDLNITPEQRTEIRAVLVEHREEIASTAKSVRSKRTALRELVLAEDTQESQIRAAASDLAEVVGGRGRESC